MSSHRQLGAEIMAALMWGPKTVPQLVEHVGAKERNVRQWVDVLKQSGVVYVREVAPRNEKGGGRLYAVQSTPFHFDDAGGEA
jgi:predicted transcriptional regulator